jgi:hypothetical protein
VPEIQLYYPLYSDIIPEGITFKEDAFRDIRVVPDKETLDFQIG